jgi:Protein of unknown function (DUF3060)
MKQCTLLFVLILAGTATADTYLDNNKTATQDCSKDPEANVAGNNNTITLTGACKRIMVTGNNNTLNVASVAQLYVPGNHDVITVEAVDAINVPGNHNTVTWTKGISANKPKVSSPGTRNKINASK